MLEERSGRMVEQRSGERERSRSPSPPASGGAQAAGITSLHSLHNPSGGFEPLRDQLTEQQAAVKERVHHAVATKLVARRRKDVCITKKIYTKTGVRNPIGFEKEMQTQVERSRADRQAKAAAALGSATIELGAAETAALVSSRRNRIGAPSAPGCSAASAVCWPSSR